MPLIYNSGTISNITGINFPKTTIIKSIMYYVTQPTNMAKNVQFHTKFGTHTNIQLWPNTFYKHTILSVPVRPNSRGSNQS